MDISTITLIVFGAMFLVLATGLPVGFALGGVGLIFTYFLWGPKALATIAYSAFDTWSTSILLAAPLFLFMGTILQESGIADDVYEMFYRWMGGLRGGLAIGTIIICTIFAAIMGISGASTITMGLIALPSMFKRGYNKELVIGAIAAGGVLGILIPPSVIMIIYAMIARESVGQMFAGGVVPGLILAGLYITYIAVRSYLQPELAPAMPREERASWRQKLVSLKAVVLPILMILVVLGSIYTGVATPTEAAAIGAVGAFICAAIYGRLTWNVVKKASRYTFMLTGMVMWILLGAATFNNLYRAVGAQTLVMDLVGDMGVHPWTVLIMMQLSLFILGMLMDDFAIVMLCVPIYVPIIKALGFNSLWFAMLFMVNMQMAYLTPPYGFNLFYMKSIVPKDVNMGHIYRSVLPFIALQFIGLILIMVFPRLALWLPQMMK
ncbi:MAG: TRAP transporter large permease subunit [Thermodesulfobacteriota bacterium]